MSLSESSTKTTDFREAEVWGYRLPPGQVQIAASIVHPEIDRLVISAPTRYGKTFSAAIGVLLFIRRNPGSRVALIGPTREQTTRLRNEIADIVATTPILAESIASADRGAAHERLRKEASKKRVTFKDGSELETYTAHGTGLGLMGSGADLVVLDESALIDNEVWRSKISRMLGDSENAQLAVLVNPWDRSNFTFDLWNSDRFKQIHIDWRQALREGRISQGFVEEQRGRLTRYEWEVLYESVYPDTAEDALFKWSWLKAAEHRDLEVVKDKNVAYGLDVAEGGPDHNVLTEVARRNDEVRVEKQWMWDEADTMKTVARVLHILQERDQIDAG